MKIHDAIFVLSAGVKKTNSGKWASTDLTVEDDLFGAPGGLLRVRATAILSRLFPMSVVVATGGRGYDIQKDTPDNRPLLSEILRDELVSFGVPSVRIVLEDKSNTTYQQLLELERMCEDYGWKSVSIVTNSWHIPRVLAFLEMKFANLRKRIDLQLISAEDILVENEPDLWRDNISYSYKSDFLRNRIVAEEQGILQIFNGTYNFQ